VRGRPALPTRRDWRNDGRDAAKAGQIDSRSAFAAACRRSLTSVSSRAANSMRSCWMSARSCWLSARSRSVLSWLAISSTVRVRAASWLATVAMSSLAVMSPDSTRRVERPALAKEPETTEPASEDRREGAHVRRRERGASPVRSCASTVRTPSQRLGGGASASAPSSARPADVARRAIRRLRRTRCRGR
jgi:hypothetical protein